MNKKKFRHHRDTWFASDAAHELRTPLAALKTHAQVALKTDNTQERETALSKIIQCADLCSHVITQLLTLSRLNHEEALQDIGPVDLKKLTTETVAYLAPTALEKNIDIELQSPSHNTILLGNAIAIGILIRNLVENAIRYTPEHGAIKIQLEHLEKKLIFRVTDTGPGIPEELRERVFERFFRAHRTSDSGNGLGLAIIRQIADLHQAKIILDTPPHGKGLQCDVIFQKIKND